ncbi:hypothetical protein [Myxococcus sp. RHSTA-1-4]|uniref:hypothetical protein n=1 Tax=Myxococcus sp. RHSTA-1-4 TaxID=2874601 RepID=UPI001CBC579C|nr:hypothetical protein [Myxococcus sp. RHSTA-1-4]MBZ4422787.1 hypothetical protein [Myxococcus sp. RHSTA-1-4]
MAPDPGKAAEVSPPAVSAGEQPPLVQRGADGVHYHFPVEITVVRKEGAVDVNAVADQVMEKLARQLEQLERERARGGGR